MKKNNYITAQAVNVSYATADIYRKQISILIRAMAKDFATALIVYKDKYNQISMDGDNEWLSTALADIMKRLGKKWADRFEKFAKENSPKLVQKILKQTDLQIKTTLKDWFASEKLMLLQESQPVALRQSIQMHVMENVSLIKSIPAQYLDRIQGVLTRALTGGLSYKDVLVEIDKYKPKELNRAKLIAKDQVNKITTSLAVRRYEQLGITKFKWVHSHASKEPRQLHITKWDGKSSPQNPNGLDGLIFDINNPPLIQRPTKYNPKPIFGLPAQLVSCKCRMYPITQFD